MVVGVKHLHFGFAPHPPIESEVWATERKRGVRPRYNARLICDNRKEASHDSSNSCLASPAQCPNSRRRCDRDRARIFDALGDCAIIVEHIGSYSAPGLASKPIVDILLVVADSPDLEAAGYVPRISEPVAGPNPLFDGVEPHRVFKGSEIDLNLHVWTRGSPEIQRNRAFRDWLRATDDDRLPYARYKLELGSHTWDNVQQYANAKTEVIEDILVRSFAAQRPAMR